MEVKQPAAGLTPQLYLGYDPASPSAGYFGPAPPDPKDPCYDQPEATVTITVIPSPRTLLDRVTSMTEGHGVFDTLQLDTDLNGLPANPFFSGQLQACRNLIQFGISTGFPVEDARRCLAGTGLPLATPPSACNGFPLTSFDSRPIGAGQVLVADPVPGPIPGAPNGYAGRVGIEQINSTSPCDVPFSCCSNNDMFACRNDIDCPQPLCVNADDLLTCNSYSCICLDPVTLKTVHTGCIRSSDCPAALCQAGCNPEIHGRCRGDREVACVASPDDPSKDCREHALLDLIEINLMNDVNVRDGGNGIFGDCQIRTCDSSAVTDDNVRSCFECDFFPVTPLMSPGPCSGQHYSGNDQLYKDLCALKDLNDPSTDSGKIFAIETAVEKLADLRAMAFRWYDVLNARWKVNDFRQTHTTALAFSRPPQHEEENSCRTQRSDPADSSRLCAFGHFLAPNAGGILTGFGGHVNFEPAAYFGRLWFENYSGPTPLNGGFNDDDDWNMMAPGGEGIAGNQGWVHVERSALDSLRQFADARRTAVGYWKALTQLGGGGDQPPRTRWGTTSGQGFRKRSTPTRKRSATSSPSATGHATTRVRGRPATATPRAAPMRIAPWARSASPTPTRAPSGSRCAERAVTILRPRVARRASIPTSTRPPISRRSFPIARTRSRSSARRSVVNDSTSNPRGP